MTNTQRPLKFRVWDKNHWKGWHDHPDGPPPNAKPAHCGEYIDGDDILDTLGHGYNAEDVELQAPPGYTIEQFTGLTDKEGREIYEGDLVNCRIDRFVFSRAHVMFEKGAFTLQIKNFPVHVPHILCVAQEIKVIGNIHDSESEE